MPALLLRLDAAGNLLGVFGTLNSGDDLTLTVSGADLVRVQEGTSTLGTFSVPGDLTVGLGNSLNSHTVLVDFTDGMNPTGSLSGSLAINLGNSLTGYTVDLFDGDAAVDEIQGSLSVNTGNGPDVLSIGATSPDVDILGDLRANMNRGLDTFALREGSSVGGNCYIYQANFIGINSFGMVPLSIGGNLIANAAAETGTGVANLYDLGQLVTLGGSAAFYTGISVLDDITILSTVLGNVTAIMGNGPNNFTLDSTSTVGGNVTFVGGSSIDVVSFVQNGSILGRATLNLGGGDNTWIWQGGHSILGSGIVCIGGSGIDTLRLDGTAPGARLTAILGSGADQVVLGDEANMTFDLILASLYVDFGTDTDSYTQVSPGVINFPTTFRNVA